MTIEAPANAGGDFVVPEIPTPPATPRRRSLFGYAFRPERRLVERVIYLLLLTGATALFLYPFIWVVSASLKPLAQVFNNQLLPHPFAWGNYSEIWKVAPVLRWTINSLYLSVLSALAVTLSSSLIAFGFAYFRFPGRNFFFACVLGTMMLPQAVTMVPVYLIWNHIGLADSQFPLWMPNLFGSSFYVFLQRQFFLGIPREIFEAARIDGDGYFSMFRRIAVPLAKPALIVTAVFEFQASWTNLMQPLIYLHNDSQYTLSLGLYQLLNQFGPTGGGHGQWQLIIAAMVIATVPMLIVFFLGQRYFVEGIATQGRKG